MKRTALIILIILMAVCLASCQYAVDKITQLGQVAQQELSLPAPEKQMSVFEVSEGEEWTSQGQTQELTENPIEVLTDTAGAKPTQEPTDNPAESPVEEPSESPSTSPTISPSEAPSESPGTPPTASPTAQPSANPIASPTASPTAQPTEMPMPTPEPTPEPTEPAVNTASLERSMVNKVNAARAAEGLPPLEVSSVLRSNARVHSADMADNNFFSHTSPTRGTFAARVNASGISYSGAGENIAYNSSVSSAHSMLMGSSGHRANILNTDFTHIGIGIEWDESEGVFYITQWFAKFR